MTNKELLAEAARRGNKYLETMSDTELMLLLAAALEELEPVRAFATEVMAGYPDFDSKSDKPLWDIALRHGMMIGTKEKKSCGKDCVCAKKGKFPHHCFRLAPQVDPGQR